MQYKLVSRKFNSSKSSLQHNSPFYLRRLINITTSHRSTRSTSVITLFKLSVNLETGNRSYSFAVHFYGTLIPNRCASLSVDGQSRYLPLTRGPFHKCLKTSALLQVISTLAIFTTAPGTQPEMPMYSDLRSPILFYRKIP